MAAPQENSDKPPDFNTLTIPGVLAVTVREIVATGRAWFILMLLVAGLVGVFPVASAMILADAVTEPIRLTTWNVLLLSSALAVPLLVNGVSDTVSQHLIRKIMFIFQREHAELVLSSDRAQLEDAEYLNTLRVAEQARQQRLMMGMSLIPESTRIGITTVGFVVAIAGLSWLLLVTVVVPSAFWIVSERYVARLNVRQTRASVRFHRSIGFRMHQMCIPDIADQIQLNAAPGFMMTKHADDLRRVYLLELRRDRRTLALRTAQFGVVMISAFVTYQWVASALAIGSLDAGQLVFIAYAYTALIMIGPSVGGVTSGIQAVKDLDPELRVYETYRRVRNAEPQKLTEANGGPAMAKNENVVPGGIVLASGPLSVIRNERKILQTKALQFRNGSMVALVGANGSGKSTLLRCIAGLIRPDAGDVTYLKRSVTDLAETSQTFGYMPQAPHIFEMSLIDNVALGRHIGTSDLASLFESVHATSWRDDLDANLRLHLGGLLADEGDKIMRPSYGEQLKLGLARALYGSRPILLLDEPTEGLDSASCSVVAETLREYARLDRLVVVATHDSDLINVCDTVVELPSSLSAK